MRNFVFFLLLSLMVTACSGNKPDKENTETQMVGNEIFGEEELAVQNPQNDVEIPEPNEDLQEPIEEEPEGVDDCIFDADYRELTVGAINSYDSTLSYKWNKEDNLAILAVGKDTLELSIGGCNHFGCLGSYISYENDLQDTAFWFNQAKWIGNSFWSSVGEELAQKIDAGQFIKTEDKTEDEATIYYEFPADTTLTNLYYTGIELTKRNNSVRMTIGAYYN